MKYIFSLKNSSDGIKQIAGGKGASLITMLHAGLPVPNGFIITADAFEDNGIRHDAAAELNAKIEKLTDKYTYAVRSSADGEDGKSASFAGAYETVLDVRRENILQAVEKVVASAVTERVKCYAENRSTQNGRIAVVVQHFVNPQYAGVLFTSDIIAGSSAKMTGNYVKGCGEALVSGEVNAADFSFDALQYKYDGRKELEPYAKKLYKSAVKIRLLYGCPMDIEWAVSEHKVYILQARPITTLCRFNRDTYEINGSLSGNYLFSKTNVGEIFMCPVSPVTYSVLESICEVIGVPCFIDNICGQAYCNISVICSLLVSFGMPKKKAYGVIADIAGKIPDGVKIPIFPFDKKAFMKNIYQMIFGKKPEFDKSISKIGKKEFKEQISDIGDRLIDNIHKLDDSKKLKEYWETHCNAYLTRVMTTIMSEFSVKPLLKTRQQLIQIAGEELANELCSNSSSSGTLESMKPLLAIEDIILGRMTKAEYVRCYGHRSVSEMELACPYPYENPDFPDNIIAEHLHSGVNVHKMKSEQTERYSNAVIKFKKLYPYKSKWLDKKLENFAIANLKRENVRSKSVKLFCLMREYLLKAADISGLGDDIFMLYFEEVLKLLGGDISVKANITARRSNYEAYLAYPSFPNIIVGRFKPDEWLKTPDRRLDVFYAGGKVNTKSDINGYAGAAGVVEGTVHVLNSPSDASKLIQGEILVTTATNIGWTTVFPKVAAIVTDIGAPLSHAAIVAREFGIPAVIGCGNATTMLKTGDYVRVDGIAGTVTKLSEPKA